MLLWCAVLLFLGIAAFLDSIFTFGEIYRRINSILFMLVSLGLLVRTSTKIRMAKRENTQKKIEELEARIAELTKTKPQKEKVEAAS
jgi:sensor histidine kinase YesM